MDHYSQLLAQINRPAAVERFSRIYGHREGTLAAQLTRYARLIKAHQDFFHSYGPLYLISAPGRTEIIGNHTDHNRGRVLAGAVNLDCVACVCPRADRTVRIISKGYPAIELSLDDLSVHPVEEGTSAALVRGVAKGMQERGYLLGGFDAAVTSAVLGGSGLSSSAAYEVLICAILDTLYNGFTVDATTRAQISQYAENVYFGKPSGLMDQMACSTGGMIAIDFKQDDPQITPMAFSFQDAGYSLVVVNTGGSHDNLTAEYAAIRTEMEAVAAEFGERVLRQVRPEQLWQRLPELRKKLGERAVLRAFHFMDENTRVKGMIQAVKNNDLGAVFQHVIASGESSWTLLQNIYPAGTSQPLALALAMAAVMLRGKGAWRVHGGGFAGTTLNFVPNDEVEHFVREMEAVFGEKCCFVLDVRPEGAAVMFATNQG